MINKVAHTKPILSAIAAAKPDVSRPYEASDSN